MCHCKICKVEKNFGERKGAVVLTGKNKSVLKEIVVKKISGN